MVKAKIIIVNVNSIKEKVFDKKLKIAITALKEATPIKTGKARDGWCIVKHSIVNDVNYINKLNNGTSKQAPKYFVEQTLLSLGFKLSGTVI
jgi:hypothetical protein